MTNVSRGTWAAAGEERRAARLVFGDRFDLAEQYAAWLADQGVVRGLIGPREVPRLWDRHLLNSAVVGELVPAGVAVRDIGSGAGLPGIPLALARPDLQVELVEPLLRRASFLTETCERLELANVTVTRARAEDLRGAAGVPVVTARALAPLLRLVGWCLPLTSPGGTLVALKGARVHEELDGAQRDLLRLGAASWDVIECGRDLLATPTTVLRVTRGTGPTTAGARVSRQQPKSRAARQSSGAKTNAGSTPRRRARKPQHGPDDHAKGDG